MLWAGLVLRPPFTQSILAVTISERLELRISNVSYFDCITRELRQTEETNPSVHSLNRYSVKEAKNRPVGGPRHYFHLNLLTLKQICVVPGVNKPTFDSIAIACLT